jgi:tRNA-splicing ligase RtcB
MALAGDDMNIMHETPHTLNVESKEGKDYIACMNLAGEYAYAGRDWVCAEVTRLLGGVVTDEVHNHHNFAWLEEHDGEKVWVIRKGATPAFPGQRGFIGSSMGDNSVIVEGVESEESKALYYSTVHGAGRIMSRMKAKGKTKRNKETGELVVKQKPMIDWTAETDLVKANGTELRGAGADECPGVYKKLPEVLQSHAGTIQTINTLRPLIVCMAGGNEFDPYKD